jgi:hypothetical protein
MVKDIKKWTIEGLSFKEGLENSAKIMDRCM